MLPGGSSYDSYYILYEGGGGLERRRLRKESFPIQREGTPEKHSRPADCQALLMMMMNTLKLTNLMLMMHESLSIY